MLYWCGKRKTNIELGAGVGEDFDLPDLTNTLDVLFFLFIVLIFKLVIICSKVKIWGCKLVRRSQRISYVSFAFY